VLSIKTFLSTDYDICCLYRIENAWNISVECGARIYFLKFRRVFYMSRGDIINIALSPLNQTYHIDDE